MQFYQYIQIDFHPHPGSESPWTVSLLRVYGLTISRSGNGLVEQIVTNGLKSLPTRCTCHRINAPFDLTLTPFLVSVQYSPASLTHFAAISYVFRSHMTPGRAHRLSVHCVMTNDIDNFGRRSERFRVAHEITCSPPAIQSRVFKRSTFNSPYNSIVGTPRLMYL